jgi:hypothetical protein
MENKLHVPAGADPCSSHFSLRGLPISKIHALSPQIAILVFSSPSVLGIELRAP